MRNARPLGTLVAGGAAAFVCAVALSCGGGDGSSNSTAPSGSCTPSTNPQTLVIMNNAICPQSITVTRGTQLIINNQDSRSHEMDSDPHPAHTDCPELNFGFINAGQTRSSNNATTTRSSCGMHDHSDPNRASLKATITIQ